MTGHEKFQLIHCPFKHLFSRKINLLKWLEPNAFPNPEPCTVSTPVLFVNLTQSVDRLSNMNLGQFWKYVKCPKRNPARQSLVCIKTFHHIVSSSTHFSTISIYDLVGPVRLLLQQSEQANRRYTYTSKFGHIVP